MHNEMLHTALMDLVDLMRIRVRLTYDVARWKWNHSAPIDHADREEALLHLVEQIAMTLSVDTRMARQFFRDQIEASKIYQRVQFERWNSRDRKEFTAVPDLHSAQRKELDALTKPLLLQLGIVLSLLSFADGTNIVHHIRLGIDTDKSVDNDITECAMALLRVESLARVQSVQE
jgi:chorismate mutase